MTTISDPTASLARRRLVLLAAAAWAGLTGAAAAQGNAPPWPVRQTRIVVPFTAGSILDIPSRILAERLSRRLRATFFVESKPGAGGGLGTMEVVRAAPDGATLLSASNSVSILPILQPRLGLDPIRDLAPVSLLIDMPVGVIVRADSPIRDLGDLIAKAKAAPGQLTYGSGGVGSAIHLATALFAAMAGIELTHVPYGGGARVLTAIHAGEVDMMFNNTIDLIPLARQGAARLLGVATRERMPAVADVPTINEVVPGYTMLQWVGMFAPKAMAPALIERLAAEMAPLREDPELNARLAPGAAIARLDGPAPLATRLAEDIATWRTVIARENIRPE